VDSAFNSCLQGMGSNPAEASHCKKNCGQVVRTYCGAEGRINQLTPGKAGTFVATPVKSFTCVGSGLLSLSSLIKSSTSRIRLE